MAWIAKAVQVLLASKELVRLVREVIRAASKMKRSTVDSKLGELVDESSKTGDQRELEKAVSGKGGEPTRHDIPGLRKRPEEPNRD